MRRSIFDIGVAAVAAATMASAVLVGAAALPLPIEPPSGRTGACFEAPATVPSTSDTVGVGTVCIDGHDVHVTLEVTGLKSGEEYTGSLRYTHRPAPCRDARTAPELLCQPIDVPGDRPTTLVKHIDAGIAPPSGTLRIQKHLDDARFGDGGEVTLELLKLREHADPQAEAVFSLP